MISARSREHDAFCKLHVMTRQITDTRVKQLRASRKAGANKNQLLDCILKIPLLVKRPNKAVIWDLRRWQAVLFPINTLNNIVLHQSGSAHIRTIVIKVLPPLQVADSVPKLQMTCQNDNGLHINFSVSALSSILQNSEGFWAGC